jgi:hypothetical protein
MIQQVLNFTIDRNPIWKKRSPQAGKNSWQDIPGSGAKDVTP